MAKRFGRPAPAIPAEESGHIVRQICLPRETNGIEGVYDNVAAIDQLHMSSDELARRRAFADGVIHWLLMIGFWASVVVIVVHMVR